MGIQGLLLAVSIAASVPTQTHTVEFLGFSKNEQLAAWAQHVQVTRSETHDSYSVVRVVNVDTQETINVYRLGPIKRSVGNMRGVTLHAESGQRMNPPWYNAKSTAAWRRLKRRHQFRTRRIRAADLELEFVADDDTQLVWHAQKGTIDVLGAPSTPLGFKAIAGLQGGGAQSLGHFRQETTSDETIRATVSMYRSRSGDVVATVAHFTTVESNHAFPGVSPQITKIGQPQRVSQAPRDLSRLTKELDRSQSAPALGALEP